MTDRLVILGSSLTALAVARDAHALGLTPVVVDCQAGIAFKSRWVVPVLVTDPSTDKVTTAVVRSAGSHSALVATGDDWLRFVVAQRTALEAAFEQILHPCNSMLETCLSKRAFSEWCTASGLPSPSTWSPGVAERPAALKFPMLIRPCESRPHLSLPKAVEVRTEPELRDWIDRFRDAGVSPLVSESLLLQRLTQYSVPFARRSNTTLSFVAEKLRPAPGNCAQGSLVELTSNVEIEQLGRLAAERAGYYGIGEVEILHSHDSGRNYLIEINARPWLQYALAPATGHDFLGWMLGAERKSAGASRVRGARKTWINLRDDRFVTLSRPNGLVRQGRLGFGAYLQSLARRHVCAVFDPRDPMPFLHTLLESAGVRIRRICRAIGVAANPTNP